MKIIKVVINYRLPHVEHEFEHKLDAQLRVNQLSSKRKLEVKQFRISILAVECWCPIVDGWLYSMPVVLLNLWPGNKGSNAYASEFLAIIGDLGNEKKAKKRVLRSCFYTWRKSTWSDLLSYSNRCYLHIIKRCIRMRNLVTV